MSTYTIGEIAERSGFTSSALRYYEDIGLVVPARSDAGYRLYDEHSLDRLAFIARAKQLGCSLEEITDLAGLWDGENCGPVQRRFHELVTNKIEDARTQLLELTTLIGQLHDAAERLSGEALDGPCGDDCACLADDRREARPRVGTLAGIPVTDNPIACTLDPEAVPDRTADWHALLRHVRARTSAADGALRLEFADTVDVAELGRLAAAEIGCCAFFAFTITVDDRGAALEVRGPTEAGEVIERFFGTAA